MSGSGIEHAVQLSIIAAVTQHGVRHVDLERTVVAHERGVGKLGTFAPNRRDLNMRQGLLGPLGLPFAQHLALFLADRRHVHKELVGDVTGGDLLLERSTEIRLALILAVDSLDQRPAGGDADVHRGRVGPEGEVASAAWGHERTVAGEGSDLVERCGRSHVDGEEYLVCGYRYWYRRVLVAVKMIMIHQRRGTRIYTGTERGSRPCRYMTQHTSVRIGSYW
ncbi:hypothetical protein TVWG_00016 [Tetraselmis viridis virus N1]|nr:hypothetical protein TVWG_00016 [Tetraselmis viridis virus N1]